MSGRRLVPGLVSRYPLGAQLPAVYADDDNAQRITEGLDEVLAPVLAVLDCLPAYLDPRLAPEDFRALLGAWVGAEGPEVAGAVRGHARRGTAEGLAEGIRRAFGVEPEIQESGAATWSATARTPLPGADRPYLTVRLRVPDPSAFDTAAVTAYIDRNRPVHLPFRVEVVPLPPRPPAPPPTPAPPDPPDPRR
ncbi:phage tail protein [Streptomyces sp. NPDC101132]|uniref:phage tail protein n=1 Tax=Streptomyces sp. NPDC101132 TaxID=3366110 RepID=UPI003800C6DD